MDLSSYADLALRLANSAMPGAKTGASGRPDISTIDGLRALLADLPHGRLGIGRGDLEAMQELRAELRAIFAACADGRDAEAVDRLNALLIQHPVHPQIAGHDGQPWHLHLTQSGCLADRYAAGAAMGLAAVLTAIGASGLGICRAASCQRAFIDATSSRPRRYCSDRCAARANIRALRARRHRGKTERRRSVVI